MIKQYRKDGRLYLWIAFILMGVLFYSSSQTYEQQSQIGLLSTLLHNEPFSKGLSHIAFDYAGSEVSIEAKGYFSFVEFFIRKGAHFGTYFLMGGSLFLGLFPRIRSVWLTAVIAWLAATGYAGLDELIELKHTALSRDIFANGALKAAQFLATQVPGRYSMEELIATQS